MNVLDLFSGIGGFSLGLERAGFSTVAFCECEPFCQAVLRKHWPDVPIFDDVRTLTGEKLLSRGVGAIDLICGGYPCQPFSSAGKRRGQEDDRHLWPEFMRLIRETRPAWVIGENVAGHISMGLDDVLSDLENEGYEARTFIVPACAVGAPHRRDRTWVVAHAESSTWKLSTESRRQNSSDTCGRGGGVMADAECLRRHEVESPDFGGARSQGAASEAEQYGFAGWEGLWPSEPGMGRVAHGIPCRVDRNKCLGNGLVPKIPEILGRAIKESCLM